MHARVSVCRECICMCVNVPAYVCGYVCHACVCVCVFVCVVTGDSGAAVLFRLRAPVRDAASGEGQGPWQKRRRAPGPLV
jgi:hypothetical protein